MATGFFIVFSILLGTLYLTFPSARAVEPIKKITFEEYHMDKRICDENTEYNQQYICTKAHKPSGPKCHNVYVELEDENKQVDTYEKEILLCSHEGRIKKCACAGTDQSFYYIFEFKDSKCYNPEKYLNLSERQPASGTTDPPTPSPPRLIKSAPN